MWTAAAINRRMLRGMGRGAESIGSEFCTGTSRGNSALKLTDRKPLRRHRVVLHGPKASKHTGQETAVLMV